LPTAASRSKTAAKKNGASASRSRRKKAGAKKDPKTEKATESGNISENVLKS